MSKGGEILRGWPTTRMRTLLISLVAVVVLIAPACTLAADHEYVVSACGDGARNAPLDGWVGSPPGAAVEACASSGGMGYELGPGVPKARWAVTVPDGARIVAFRMYSARGVGDPR